VFVFALAFSQLNGQRICFEADVDTIFAYYVHTRMWSSVLKSYHKDMAAKIHIASQHFISKSVL
jgi:uncharacterized membrane protein